MILGNRRRMYVAAALVLIITLIGAWAAFADDVANNADASVDATYETVTLLTTGASRQIDLYIVTQNGDGKQGCNLTGSTKLVLNVTSTIPAVATVFPSQITFTNCEAVGTNLSTAVTVAPVAAGTTKIEFSLVSNDTGGTFNLDSARFTVDVALPPNTPPVVSITGVKGGASYEFGLVPAASCSVSDAEDGPKTVAPVIGPVKGPLATYGLGSQEVTCSYTDSGGLTTTASATYAIVDTIAPVIAPHGDETAQATGKDGAMVAYTSPTASDAVDSAPTVICEPASDGRFALGDTTVTCNATDAAGNHATPTTFKVTVQDTAPVIASHDDVTAEATSKDGALVSYTAPATTDAVDGSGTATCAPASGSTFALGDTMVTCNAADKAGNQATPTTFVVHVVDTTPPVITAHGNEQAEATSAAGAVINYTSPATNDAVDGAGTATCAPASGSTFALGDTMVTCNAADKAGNAATPTTFVVHVVDTTPPSITWVGGPTDESSHYFGQVPGAPTCTALDIVSGQVACTISGYGTDVGTHSLKATAYDAAGNKAEETRSYTVLAWTLSGFYQPVDMPTTGMVYNTVKNGSTVPLKFEIFAGLAGSSEQTSVSAVQSLTVAQTTCDPKVPMDDFPPTMLATGNTSLRYDATAGQFIYNWKTSGTTGKCYRATMTAIDGTSLTAYFKLK
jgi:hypothetical protein